MLNITEEIDQSQEIGETKIFTKNIYTIIKNKSYIVKEQVNFPITNDIDNDWDDFPETCLLC